MHFKYLFVKSCILKTNAGYKPQRWQLMAEHTGDLLFEDTPGGMRSFWEHVFWTTADFWPQSTITCLLVWLIWVLIPIWSGKWTKNTVAADDTLAVWELFCCCLRTRWPWFVLIWELSLVACLWGIYQPCMSHGSGVRQCCLDADAPPLLCTRL